MDINNSSPILVTGATGYIGSHIVKNLLDKGYKVRASVRSGSKKVNYSFLYDLTQDKDQLEIVEADLLDPTSWEKAAKGCKYVIHSACPNLSYEPRNKDELIKPSVNGTMNVLNAALKEGVRKSVLTSTLSTMWVGQEEKVISEKNVWIDESNCDAFHKSKILTEKAVYDFWNQNKEKMEIVIVNPGFAIGPVLTNTKRSSVEMIMKLITGKFPALPNICLAAVDVRDVAEAHVRALFAENNNGKRYIISKQSLWLDKIASILKGEFGPHGYDITERKVPSNYLKYAAWFDSEVKKLMPYLDKEMNFDNSLSVEDLKMTYRPPEQSLIEMCYSLINYNVIPNKIKAQMKMNMMTPKEVQ